MRRRPAPTRLVCKWLSGSVTPTTRESYDKFVALHGQPTAFTLAEVPVVCTTCTDETEIWEGDRFGRYVPCPKCSAKKNLPSLAT